MSKQNVNQINYCLSHILIASFTNKMGINLLLKKCESNKALFVIHLKLHLQAKWESIFLSKNVNHIKHCLQLI